MNIENFIGLSEQAAETLAEKHHMGFMVIARDGVTLNVPMDFRTDRITVTILDGSVYTVTIC